MDILLLLSILMSIICTSQGIEELTEAELKCGGQPSNFLTSDGTCNNLFAKNKGYGAAHTRFLRMCKRIGKFDCDDDPRPSPQFIVDNLFEITGDRDDGTYSAFLTYFGQFLDHDITLTENTEFNCMENEKQDTPELVCENHLCFDQGLKQCPFNSSANNTKQCFKFTRSESLTSDGEQVNSITSFIDASNVYGSSKEKTDSLRSFENGKLRVQKDRNCGFILPFEDGKENDCGAGCFKAGDIRANENPILVAFHTLFVLEHNRLCDVLIKKYSAEGRQLNDEQMFQIVRKIVKAEMQNIVYDEYLPELGFTHLKIYDSLKDYNKLCNPGIFQEFSTAAYRFGHSAVKNVFEFGYNVQEKVNIRDIFFKTDRFRKHCTHGILYPQILRKSEKIDNIFTEGIGRKLFIPSANNDNFQSLPALNIQRGRDHRLGSYKCVLEYCLAKTTKDPITITSFEDLTDLVGQTNVEKLKKVYKNNVDDIDLFVGGLLEKPQTKFQRMGPTFHCIIEEQFKNLKNCDRHFYKNCQGSQDVDKCLHRVENLRLRKMSHIICDNTPLREIKKKNVFKLEEDILNCDKTHDINMDLWVK